LWRKFFVNKKKRLGHSTEKVTHNITVSNSIQPKTCKKIN
jgi:hypothetical protein